MKAPDLAQRAVTKEAVELFEKPIGQLMLNFAMIDHALDFWLMELFPKAVKANVASKMPYELGRKIDLLSKCLNRLPAYASIKSEALALLIKVEKHNRTRNTLAHGAMSHSELTPVPTVLFVRLSYSKDNGVHMMRDETIALPELEMAIEETVEALVGMHHIAKMIHQIGPA